MTQEEVLVEMNDMSQTLSYDVFIQKANALKVAGRYKEAEATLAEGMQAIPDELWLAFHHAFLATELQEWPIAVERWQAFCQRFPDHPDGHAFFALALFETGSVEEADVTIVAALSKFGATQSLLETRAKLFERCKKWDESIYVWDIYHRLSDIKKYGLKIDLFPKTYPRYQINKSIIPGERKISAFGYWNTEDHSLLPFIGLWKHIFNGSYKVISDKDILKIISVKYPNFAPIYQKISIPACKSDLARLIYIYEYGGVYIDMHCVLGNFSKLEMLAEMYRNYSAVFFSYPSDDQRYHVGNSILMAHKGAPVIKHLIDKAIANVWEQYDNEQNGKQDGYNIYKITGPAHIENVIMGPDAHWQVIVDEYRDSTFCVKMDMARTGDIFHPFYAYPYRTKGAHWSERQNKEKLFIE